MEQKVVCREEELEGKENASQKNSQLLEEGMSGRATCYNNSLLCDDNTNDERDEMFSLMKTSDSASSSDTPVGAT